MATIRKVHLKDLKKTFYVRTALDQDYALKLADLYAAGVKLPPLKVTATNEIIDGRHRMEAMEVAFNGDHEAEVEIVRNENPLELIAMAFDANEGGPMPNSRADGIHTVQMLISRGATERFIYEKLKFPRGVLRVWIDRAKANLKRGLIQQAKEAVANGEGTVKAIADRFGLDVNDLKKAIAGPKTSSSASSIGQMKQAVSARTFVATRAHQAMIKRLVEGYLDGAVPEKTVDQVLSHMEALNTAHGRRLQDWRSRLEAAKNGKLLSWNAMSESEEG